MKRMTGREWKEFYNSDWDALIARQQNTPGVDYEAYYDGSEITVDGIDLDDLDYDDIDITDAAKVTVKSGVVCTNSNWEMPLERFYELWKKNQTHATLVVSVPLDKLEVFKEYLKSIGGKV